MENTIRPVQTSAVGSATASKPVAQDTQTESVPQDSVIIGERPAEPQQPSVQQQSSAPPAVEQQPAAPPAPVMPPEHPQGFVNVPVTLAVPIELVTPDANGNIPLSQYTPDLRPPGAIYTTQQNIQELVETVKKQTLPPGTHPELNNSPGGQKVDVAQKTVAKLIQSVGGIAAYSLAREGAMLTIPAPIAAPIALVAGGIGIYTGLEQTKQSLNLKGYYEGLKKEGVSSLPMQVPVRTKEGPQVQVVEVPIDQMIQGAKDASVVGGAQALSSALMIASGAAMLAALPVAPALAIGSVVLSVAGPLYAARGQFAMVAKAVWEKIKDKLHIGQGEKQDPAVDPAAAPKPEPEVPATGGAEQPPQA